MSGRWPRLVRPELCTDEAVVTLTDGENGDGSPAVAEVLTLPAATVPASTVRSCRGRDPDGTVNYTKLELE